MPDSRPFSSLRLGFYDDPPANSEASTPRTRRHRLHRALRATAGMALEPTSDTSAGSNMPERSTLGPLQRRRQRSPFPDSLNAANESQAVEESGRRRSKRRKLESELSPPPRKSIKYGYYGQVEPGRLKLEIISCDGGEHRDPRHPSTYLGSLNVLRHDKSVYCSESPSTSIVLRHADDTPFCLEKLHIVGPEHGFTAPVREGVVYIGMTLNDLSTYLNPPPHARIGRIDTPPFRHRRRPRASSDRITLSEALRDPEIISTLDARERDYARTAEAARDLAEELYYSEDLEPSRPEIDVHCDIPLATVTSGEMQSDDQGSLPITFLSDEEPGPEENSSQEVLDFRLQRLRNMRHRFEMENWDRQERWPPTENTHPSDSNERDSSWSLRHLDAMMARSRMMDSPQRDDPDDPDHPGADYDDYDSDRHREEEDYGSDRPEDPKITFTRFHIRRGKYKVAIKFDPPVSGRFILLKLWSNRGNVDVQSVIAKGFGGSRFFPALEFR